MPAARDLTGSRFGRLSVIRRDGKMRYGRDHSAWLCQCDCGRTERLPLPRLTSVAHRVEACEVCRSRLCEVCQGCVPPASTSATCSAECAAERRRRYQRLYYHDVRALDPADRAARAARAAAKRAKMTPEERLADSRKRAAGLDREAVNAQARARHAARMADPEYRAERAAKRHARRTESEAAIQAARSYSADYAARRRARDRAAEVARLISTDGEIE